jgi:transcriptional regulator with XRE-family HTH domain
MQPSATIESPHVAISKEDRAFFTDLGARIANLRKAQSITQVQLAEALGVSQQTMNAYEMGHRRVPVSALTRLARQLGVAVEELLGEALSATKKRGPAPKLQQQIERIQQLPRTQQKLVMQMLDGVISHASR